MPQGREKINQTKATARDNRVLARKVRDAIAPVRRDNPSPAERSGADERKKDDDD